MTTRAPMRIGLALGMLLALSTPATAILPTLQFDMPAQAKGNMALDGMRWALLIFGEQSDAEFRMDLAPESTTNRSQVVVDAEQPGTFEGQAPTPRSSLPEPMQDDLHAKVSFRDSWSSLYLEADSIQLQVDDAQALLNLANGRAWLSDYRPERRVPDGAYDTSLIPPAQLLWAVDSADPQTNFAVSLQADGIRRMQWHNATLACSTEACLDGARDQGFSVPIPGGWARSRVLSIREVTTSNGVLEGTGTPWSVVAGGARLSADVQGWLRLPNAHVEGQCGEAACADPAGRTLQVQGQISLQDLEPVGPDRRVTSQFSATAAVARIDESSPFRLDAGSTWAVIAASSAGLLWILWKPLVKPLVGLFARKTQPLEHARGKAIHDLVHETPGISFTQLRKRTGWGHSSVHYHLQRLLKKGLIVAHPFSKSIHYYENHGRHKHDWKGHAALHQAELRALHEWISDNPRAQQVGIIEAASAWGWKRATTQHRLKRLLDAGLVEAHREPNSVAYLAIRPPSA